MPDLSRRDSVKASSSSDLNRFKKYQDEHKLSISFFPWGRAIASQPRARSTPAPDQGRRRRGRRGHRRECRWATRGRRPARPRRRRRRATSTSTQAFVLHSTASGAIVIMSSRSWGFARTRRRNGSAATRRAAGPSAVSTPDDVGVNLRAPEPLPTPATSRSANTMINYSG